mgnify:CR=1 FL=1
MLLARNNHACLLWGNEPEQIAKLKSERCNAQFIADVLFPESLQLSDDLIQSVKESRDVLIVVPSEAFRSTVKAISGHIREATRIECATQGFEPGSGMAGFSVVLTDLPPG